MELLEYYRLFRRWVWLIFISAFIGGSVMYIVGSRSDPSYRAEAKISVGTFMSSPNPQTGDVSLGQDLASTYAQLVRTYEVMEATVNSLNLPISADALLGSVRTRIIPDTSLIVIETTYGDPVLAAEIANEVATQLILLSPTNLTPEQQAQVDIATTQVEELRLEVEDLRLELREVDEAIEDAEEADAIERLIAQRNALYQLINDRATNIASFVNTIASYTQQTNAIEIVETARVSPQSIGTNPIQNAILGILTGAALSMGVILVLEYLNDSFRSAAEVANYLKLPVLGVIARQGNKRSDTYGKNLITESLFSPVQEQYRTLRTNIMFKSPEDAQRTYIITSALPSEGKTLTAANLAISHALADMRVLLIDGDLRKPKLHEVFNLDNMMGLSTLLTDISLSRVTEGDDAKAFRVSDQNWKQCVQNSGVPNLKVITSGYSISNPVELLGSVQMSEWIKVLREILDVDIIIIDTPPALIASDSVILASTTNAHVILVVEANRTRQISASQAKERFTNLELKILGVALNGVEPRDEGYYGYRSQYYYYSEETPIGQR